MLIRATGSEYFLDRGVNVARSVDDKDYISFLPTRLQVNRYLRWKEQMLLDIDNIIAELDSLSIDDVMEQRNLTPKDVALLVRLRYVTAEEVERYDLGRIEKMVSV